MEYWSRRDPKMPASGDNMKKIALLVLLILFAGMGVAAADEAKPYWIDPDANNVTFNYTDTIPAGESVVTYAKQEAGYSPDGESTFEFFDGFDGSELDTSKWDEIGSQTSIDNSLTVSGGYSSWAGITSTQTFESGYIYDYYAQFDVSLNSEEAYWFGLGDDVDSNGDRIGFIRQIGGSGSTYQGYVVTGVDSGDVFDSNYHKYSFIYNSDNVDFYLDGSNEHTYSTPSMSSPVLAVGTYSGTSYEQINIQSIAVRQYADTTTTITDMGSYYKIEITNNEATDLTNYQVQLDAASLGITSDTESWHFYTNPDPEVSVNLTSPADNAYINHNNFSFNITGNGEINASLYIDDVPRWNETSITNVTNTATINLTEGSHQWYVNASATGNNTTVYNTSDVWSFTYDITDPNASIIDVSPDSNNVANETTVQTNIKWSDSNLKNASFYVDTGSGYTLNDTTTFSSSDWFNTTIDTTGLVGNVISWKQVAYDEAGNKHTYSDSFNVIESELNIYVYDEKTGEQILPSSVVVYNENLSREATIAEVTKVASLSYDGLETAKYIVSVDADSYYQRNSIVNVDVTSLTELNVYLPSENETVIFDKFILSDNTNTYEESDCILRLDKPLPNGTDTVFSTYFDFDGVTSTYLIAADQYLLYIETPDRTINYGWLTPDSDGEININLQDVTYNKYYEDWLDYLFTSNNESQTISLDYESDYPVNNVLFTVQSNEEEVYNSSIDTDTGSFTYVTGEDGEYIASVEIDTDNENFSRDWVVTFGNPDQVQFFPDSYPDWLKSVIVLCIIIAFALALSAYRADLAAVSTAMIYGAGVYNSWVPGNEYTVSIIAIIAVGALIKYQRKHDRSIT